MNDTDDRRCVEAALRMPTVPPYTNLYYEPLTEDMEELLGRFQQTESVRFQDFSAIWRQMSFSDIFVGITSNSEMRRFCAVALNTALTYFLPPYSFQIRVGGLYLMFALYQEQPAFPRVEIRLALRDWSLVHKFLRDSVEAGHIDVLYVYRRLEATRALHYTAMPYLLSFQKMRKPKKAPVCADFVGRTSAVSELICDDFLEELTNIQNHYEKMKAGDEKVRCQATMTQPDFASRLKDCAAGFLTWQTKTFSCEEAEEEEAEGAEAESSSRARLLSSIKNKSYSNFQETVKSRRHRQGEVVDEPCFQEGALAPPRRKRPQSLRSRTNQSLGSIPQEENKLQIWLLTAPHLEKVPTRRSFQQRFKP